jgi:hypothetical protein
MMRMIPALPAVFVSSASALGVGTTVELPAPDGAMPATGVT